MRLGEELPPDEVRVDYVHLDEAKDPARIQRYHALLSPEEAERLARYRFEDNRHELLLTRALARTTLARYTGLRPEELEFDKNEHGCPFLKGSPEIQRVRFNLSNTHGLVAIAVALDRDVGVDVEWMDRRTETTSVAHRFFSAFESNALKALPLEDQRDRFFQYWTLKEAYIKARQMGLAIPLGKFSFELDRQDGAIGFSTDESLADDATTWRFWQSSPTQAHRLAVAARARPDEPRLVLRAVVP